MLFAKTEKQEASPDGQIMQISVDHLEPMGQLRTVEHVKPALLERIGESIEEEGALVPLLVTQLGDDRYGILDGHSRWASARRKKVETLPCILCPKPASTAEALVIALATNVSRNSIGALDTALALHRIKKDLGPEGVERAKKATGLSSAQVSHLLREAEIPDEVITAIRAGLAAQKDDDWRLSERHLRACSRLNDKPSLVKEQARIAKQTIEQKWTVAQAEAAVEKILGKKSGEKRRGRPRAPKPVVVPDMPERIHATISTKGLAILIPDPSGEKFLEQCRNVASILGARTFDPRGLLGK